MGSTKIQLHFRHCHRHPLIDMFLDLHLLVLNHYLMYSHRMNIIIPPPIIQRLTNFLILGVQQQTTLGNSTSHKIGHPKIQGKAMNLISLILMMMHFFSRFFKKLFLSKNILWKKYETWG